MAVAQATTEPLFLGQQSSVATVFNPTGRPPSMLQSRLCRGARVMRNVVLALTMALLAGCATANETFGMGQMCGLHPYCGAATDIEIIKGSTNDNDVYSRALAPFAIVDLPFSVVADTLILPYTIFHMRPAEE
ncbi:MULTISPECIES: YceK/YidQ family lipoprotein [unclassified Pseudomonas]|uniref:YceK/YidQ family lipoprotein n=1 Tax=unclassified Pseudomonas TaxID=196821 RepID=UPI002115821A|nr:MULTISPECIES: YceK/YidQ family lipoprotein [unclassified Pseudomonas]